MGKKKQHGPLDLVSEIVGKDYVELYMTSFSENIFYGDAIQAIGQWKARIAELEAGLKRLKAECPACHPQEPNAVSGYCKHCETIGRLLKGETEAG